ncbi:MULTISPECIES: SDR family NAD(P)-dependent oxidoreductase [unclassified Halomonas]|uniref:SDR family NAD(P)-dependent oxidoreductase n=1 Tax=unclassified Halomonas TaxID=2609666 RepID=UPI001BE842D6|nr:MULTISPECIES: SDR family NAD(P)-dependent oxidoreductase [unclassified Halomonas]MBT2785933.1 SDR family NAD(P)-dependent oxidoreductase [Halomonas sp. ISL-106]MBT2799223.1 SDR family NAD(P)-dependent oxidoreductase [Halomonas sp. ISL-104]
MFSLLPHHYTALVVGASGGIGAAIIKQLLSSSQVGHIIAVSRQPPRIDNPRLTYLMLDVSQERGRQALKKELAAQPIHFFFNAIGILHDDAHRLVPEKRLDQLSAESLAHTMNINAFVPILLLAALKDSFKGSHPAVIASLSARVGSIGDNQLGGWYSYRASKAAHNMLLKTASIELKRLNKQSTVLCLHPGTTDTALSKPFQARVSDDKLFTPAFVAEQLLAVIARRTPDDSGTFWAWDGQPIDW